MDTTSPLWRMALASQPPSSYICPTCNQDRPASSYGRTKDRPRRFQDCRKCRREKAIADGKCATCFTYRPEQGQKRCPRCLKTQRDCSLKRHRALRLVALQHYAVNRLACACCGETDVEFLTLDHIDNNGAEQRRSMASHTIWNWLKQNGYPPGFQVLCFNCNSIFGECPHETRRRTGVPVRPIVTQLAESERMPEPTAG